MSANSLVSLLDRMKQGPVTQGWGAISMFNRAQLNRLLEQQYIERFNDLSFLPPLMGDFPLIDEKSGNAELRSIALGKPLLSFNTASLLNAKAVLTMNIVAGTYTAMHQPAGVAVTLSSAVDIAEQHGFKLEMEIDLSMVVGEIDRQGKVTLDLAQGTNFRCNLAGADELANTRLAAFFQRSFESLPPHRSVFQLGMLDFVGYSPLTPIRFRILTQAAPGSKVRSASNFGEGGVVIFIRLQGNTADGQFPPDSSFPYLIPDDQELNGSDRYSASLIVSRDMIAYADGDRMDVLNSLLFPGANVFQERERHTPYDLAVFGNISPQKTSISLEPRFKTIKAGETQRFIVYNGEGAVIQATSWRAVSLESHTAEGHGTIVGGLYTAVTPALIGHKTLRVVVTADYVDASTTYTASALLLVVFDSMVVSPQMAAFPVMAQPQPVTLSASTLDDAAVTWTLREPKYGSLVAQDHNRALFTPDARSKAKGLVAQHFEPLGSEQVQTSLLLVNAQQLLRVDPPHVSGIKKSANVQLLDDTTLLPGSPRRWKVISGGGSVDPSGRFSAPSQGSTSSSVVQCEIVRNGVVFSSGYSVIELSEVEPEPTWSDLLLFTIKVPGGLDGGRLGAVYCNGYQQLRVEITTETALVGGINYPLSVTERASMKLVDNATKDEIGFVDAALDGIPETDLQVWRTRLTDNRFELANPLSAAQDNLPRYIDPSVQNYYLHSRARAGMAMTFHAKFQDDKNEWWASTDKPTVNSTVEITPRAIPEFPTENYTFVRKRVDGGGSDGSGAPGDDPENDDFDFHLNTIDYWKLAYPGTRFETLEFLPVNGKGINTSMIRWESEQLAEIMFSWTGYIFRDPKKQSETTTKIQFDDAVKDIVKNESLDKDVNESVFEQGKLVISLHRSDAVAYVARGDEARDKLDNSLAVLLIDKQGNPHLRRISFLAPSVVGDRNRLEHTLFTPAQPLE
jgi:hypothetical protein